MIVLWGGEEKRLRSSKGYRSDAAAARNGFGTMGMIGAVGRRGRELFAYILVMAAVLWEWEEMGRMGTAATAAVPGSPGEMKRRTLG